VKTTLEYYPLQFIRPAGTSRGVMNVKQSWFLRIEDRGIVGIGEISIIEGLSPEYEDQQQFEHLINQCCDAFDSGEIHPENLKTELKDFPSLLFAFESALMDLQNGGKQLYFNNGFSSGLKKIPINGLVWMGDEGYMQEQISEKLKQGFTTIKMKIGAIDLETELSILRAIRKEHSAEEITLRVDANGAFSPEEAKELLKKLAKLEIHSIEQPIRAGNWKAMKELCATTPTPIALDEELIGINERNQKIELLETIQPQFIILKPSLHGGISGTQEWIELAQERKIDWWMTSALESNIGLNVICQLTAEYDNPLPQGLGTGSLYTNNVASELVVEGGFIRIVKNSVRPNPI
jgi:o-succinylbenzoate synthase